MSDEFKRVDTLDGVKSVQSAKERAAMVVSFVTGRTKRVVHTFYFDSVSVGAVPRIGMKVMVGMDGPFVVNDVCGYYPDPSNGSRLLFIVYVDRV